MIRGRRKRAERTERNMYIVLNHACRDGKWSFRGRTQGKTTLEARCARPANSQTYARTRSDWKRTSCFQKKKKKQLVQSIGFFGVDGRLCNWCFSRVTSHLECVRNNARDDANRTRDSRFPSGANWSHRPNRRKNQLTTAACRFYREFCASRLRPRRLIIMKLSSYTTRAS